MKQQPPKQKDPNIINGEGPESIEELNDWNVHTEQGI